MTLGEEEIDRKGNLGRRGKTEPSSGREEEKAKKGFSFFPSFHMNFHDYSLLLRVFFLCIVLISYTFCVCGKGVVGQRPLFPGRRACLLSLMILTRLPDRIVTVRATLLCHDLFPFTLPLFGLFLRLPEGRHSPSPSPQSACNLPSA